MTEDAKKITIAVKKVLKEFHQKLESGSWDGTHFDLLEEIETDIERALKA